MKNFGFNTAVYKNSSIYWMTRDRTGILVKTSINDGSCKLIDIDKGLNTNYSNLLCAFNSGIYGVFNSGEIFFKYDIDQGKVFTYDIDRRKYALDFITFAGGFGNKLKVIGRYSSKMLVIDLENVELKECELLSDNELSEDNRLFSRGYIRQGDKLIIFNQANMQILEIDLQSDEVNKKPLKVDIGYIEDGVAIDENYILLNSDGELYRVDNSFGNPVKLFNTEYKEGYQEFSGLICNGKEILILPMFGKRYVVLDALTLAPIDEFGYPENSDFKTINVVETSSVIAVGHTPSIIDVDDLYCIGMYGVDQLLFVKKDDFSNRRFLKVRLSEKDELNYLLKRGIRLFDEKEYSLKEFMSIVP